jgi:hypothetical protein
MKRSNDVIVNMLIFIFYYCATSTYLIECESRRVETVFAGWELFHSLNNFASAGLRTVFRLGDQGWKFIPITKDDLWVGNLIHGGANDRLLHAPYSLDWFEKTIKTY